jgi:hypothetical protein
MGSGLVIEKIKVPYPVGLEIVEVRMMTKDELAKEGWDESFGNYPVMLILEDGGRIYASSDPEGNDVGCLFGMTGKGEEITIAPLEDIIN